MKWFAKNFPLMILTIALLLNASGTAMAKSYKVAIANFGTHPSLTWVIDGFKAGLAANGFKEGVNASFDYKDASFDPSVMAQMLTALEAGNPDILLTVTTPITQASKRVIRNRNLPIVFAPVTDPVEGGLVPSWERGSDRFVGASNIQDMPTVIKFAKKLLGDVKSFGLLFNPGDANDMNHVKNAKIAAKQLGVELKTVSVEAAGDIPNRVAVLRGVEFIYLAPSSMIAPAMPALSAAARRLNIPVINSTSVGVKEGLVLASISVSWSDVGFQAGVLAAKILNGAKPSDLPVFRSKPEDHKPMISAKQLKKMGLSLPDSLKNCNCVK